MSWLDEFVSQASFAVDDRAREALWARGVTDEQILGFKIGYVDRQLPDTMYPKSFLDWSRDGSKLDDMLVLPLTNALGELKGLQFRHVVRERTGYSDFIPEKGEAVLFGLAEAMPAIWARRSVFLVEGGFDLFPVQRFVPNVVATLTAHVSKPFLRILRRTVREVWLGYDMDNAGRRASAKFKDEHAGDFERIHTLSYPKVTMADGKLSKDPGELWEAWGDAQFSAFLRSVMSRADHEMEPFNAEDLRSR